VGARATERTRARYDRIAPAYDRMETFMERRYSSWRQRVWSLVVEPKVLEVGVGTGKNMPYYPPDVQVTAVDLSPRMLERARARAKQLGIEVTLLEMDAQALQFPDASFDSAIATFVFCSVPDPVLGLQEVARVVNPGGRIVLLEHVRAANRLLGALMDIADPLVSRLMGPHISRRTVDNVRLADLTLERVEDLGARGIFKLIVARANG